MTKNKLIYLLLLGGLIFLYIMFVDKVAFIILILAVIFPFIQYFTLQIVSRKTTLALQTESDICERNQDSRINITISNSSFFPVSCAMITADIENLMTGEKQELTTMFPVSAKNQQSIKFSVTYNHCGKVRISLSKIIIYDYVKLFSKKKKTSILKDITVIPPLTAINPVVETSYYINTSDDAEYSKTKPGDDCSEIFDIRQYSFGDKINRIHWNLSSKTDMLMVKEYSLPISNQLIIIFDIPVDSLSSDAFSKIDTAIDSVMSLSVFMTDNSINHKIYWYDHSTTSVKINTIKTSEDFFDFLRELYMSSLYRDECFSFINYYSEANSFPSSHTIYLSTVFSDELLHNFSVMPHSMKKTYLYIKDNSTKLNNTDCEFDNFVSTGIPINNISETLSNIII